jgi:hypothetical protein
MVHIHMLLILFLCVRIKYRRSCFVHTLDFLVPSPPTCGQKLSVTSACVKQSLKSSIFVFLGKRVLLFLRQLTCALSQLRSSCNHSQVELVLDKVAPWHLDTFFPSSWIFLCHYHTTNASHIMCH